RPGTRAAYLQKVRGRLPSSEPEVGDEEERENGVHRKQREECELPGVRSASGQASRKRNGYGQEQDDGEKRNRQDPARRLGQAIASEHRARPRLSEREQDAGAA